MHDLRKLVVIFGGISLVVFTTIIILLSIAVPSGRNQEIEDFNGYPTGVIIAGQTSDGGDLDGILFPNIRLSVTNRSGGPNALTLVNSWKPVGRKQNGSQMDYSRNPGIKEKRNIQREIRRDIEKLGNLLVIAGTSMNRPGEKKPAQASGRTGGGTIFLDFDLPTTVYSIVLVDISTANQTRLALHKGLELVGSVDTQAAGSSCLKRILLDDYGPITRLAVDFSDAGAIGEITLGTAFGSKNNSSWGETKNIFD